MEGGRWKDVVSHAVFGLYEHGIDSNDDHE